MLRSFLPTKDRDDPVPFLGGLLGPGIKILPAHVALHHAGVIFFVSPLVDLPGLLALKLALEGRSGAHLSAGLDPLARGNALTVDGPVTLLVEELTATQAALPGRVAVEDDLAQLYIEEIPQRGKGIYRTCYRSAPR